MLLKGFFMKMFQLLICVLLAFGIEKASASELGSPSSKSYSKTVSAFNAVCRQTKKEERNSPLFLVNHDEAVSPDTVCHFGCSPKADRHKKLKAGKRKDEQRLAILK